MHPKHDKSTTLLSAISGWFPSFGCQADSDLFNYMVCIGTIKLGEPVQIFFSINNLTGVPL